MGVTAAPAAWEAAARRWAATAPVETIRKAPAATIRTALAAWSPAAARTGPEQPVAPMVLVVQTGAAAKAPAAKAPAQTKARAGWGQAAKAPAAHRSSR